MCLICAVQSFSLTSLTMSTAEVRRFHTRQYTFFFLNQRINGFPQSVLSSSYKGFWKQITINTTPSLSLGFNSAQIVDV